MITTSHSWISTSEAITRLEAKPVFVDTREDFNINEEKIEKNHKKTKALLIVHLYGVPCNMTKILKYVGKIKYFLLKIVLRPIFQSTNKIMLELSVWHLRLVSFQQRI